MKVFHGTIVHSTRNSPLQIEENKYIGVDKSKIVFIDDEQNLQELQTKYEFSSKDIQSLAKGQVLMPGFIDGHVHAPQFANIGLRLDLPLLDWLERYTFPTEKKFADVDFARRIYQSAVKCLLANGTTTASYFGTIHVESTLELCEICNTFGQRAFVGKVSMDTNTLDESYNETTQDALADAERFVEEVLRREYHLVQPIVTPRFACCCSEKCLQGLARIASKYQLLIQSHIAENVDELALVRQLFPHCNNYTDVYDSCGLMTERTIMAHGIYLTEEELEVFRARKSGIVHCPNSNMSIRSGLCKVRNLQRHEVKVGLGTDVSGGYHPSMINAIQMAVQTSNVLTINGTEQDKVDYREAFRLSTLGGAEALGISDKVGNFEVGKEFDALVVDATDGEEAEGAALTCFPERDTEDLVQRLLFLGSYRNIREVYVAGRLVHSR